MTTQLVASFAPTIPTGTAIATPATIAMNVPSRLVRAIRVRVPPGPAGLMGFQIASGGQQVIPENAGAWVVADNEVFRWDLLDFPEGGAYQLIGYNTGIYPHTLQVTFELDPVGTGPPMADQPLPFAAISSPPGPPSALPAPVGAPAPPSGPGGPTDGSPGTVVPVGLPPIGLPPLPPLPAPPAF